jgi:hypothetical protein
LNFCIEQGGKTICFERSKWNALEVIVFDTITVTRSKAAQTNTLIHQLIEILGEW